MTGYKIKLSVFKKINWWEVVWDFWKSNSMLSKKRLRNTGINNLISSRVLYKRTWRMCVCVLVHDAFETR